MHAAFTSDALQCAARMLFTFESLNAQVRHPASTSSDGEGFDGAGHVSTTVALHIACIGEQSATTSSAEHSSSCTPAALEAHAAQRGASPIVALQLSKSASPQRQYSSAASGVGALGAAEAAVAKEPGRDRRGGQAPLTCAPIAVDMLLLW